MKTLRVLLPLLFAVWLPAALHAEDSDLVTPQQRTGVVDMAKQLLQSRALVALAADAASPFAPPGFEQPDPEEVKAQQAAAAAAGAAVAPVGQPSANAPDTPGVLQSLVERIVPSGIVRLGDERFLLFGQKKLKVGDRLTITYEGSDYDLDITAIGDNSFTLRHNHEEITRSIKSGK